MSNLAMESQSDQNPNSNSQHDNHESVQPSFDEVVELISTGRADQIPGIKEIPLKVSERIYETRIKVQACYKIMYHHSLCNLFSNFKSFISFLFHAFVSLFLSFFDRLMKPCLVLQQCLDQQNLGKELQRNKTIRMTLSLLPKRMITQKQKTLISRRSKEHLPMRDGQRSITSYCILSNQ